MTAPTASDGKATTTERAAQPSSRPPSRLRTLGWALLAVIAAFLAGAGWQYLRAERIDDQLRETRVVLAATQLEAALATAVIEAQQGNHELSRQRASVFFTGLQRRVESGDDVPAGFRDILARRDEAITMLSRASPEAAALLLQLYVEFRTEVNRSGGRPALELVPDTA